MHFINEYCFDFVLQRVRIVDRWPPNKVSGVVNTRLHLPSEASLFSFSELSEPTTTDLIPFSRKLVWISSLLQFAVFEEIYRKRRDMKGKTFSYPASSKHLDHWGRLLPPCFDFLWHLRNLAYLNRSLWLLIPWSWVSTWAGDQVSKKMTSNYMTVSDWRLLLPHPQTHRRPKIWSVENGALQVRKVLLSMLF